MPATSPLLAPHPTHSQSFLERAEHPCTSPLAAYLLRLMHYKRTNLCVSADVTTSRELLLLADEVGEHICMLKTHADIVSDWSERTAQRLTELARRKKFLIFEDRKFGDIGKTLQEQYTGGQLRIVRWAEIVNAHVFPGPAVIEALKQAAERAIAAWNNSVQTEIRASPAASVRAEEEDEEETEEEEEESQDIDGDGADSTDAEESDSRARKPSVVSVSTTISMKSEALISPVLHSSRRSWLAHLDSSSAADDDDDSPETLAAALEYLGPPPPCSRSLLLLAQMSSADNLLTPTYTAACVAQARLHRGFVMGFIAQQSLNEFPEDNFLTLTPGVQIGSEGDGLGQQYNTPRKVVSEQGSDVIIVGRGVMNAKNRKEMAREYRVQGWEAFTERRKRAAQTSREREPEHARDA